MRGWGNRKKIKKLLWDFKQEGCHSHLRQRKALVIKGQDVGMEDGVGCWR